MQCVDFTGSREMKTRITTFSLIIAATCAIGFNQAAKAEDEDVRHVSSMRFDFGSNTYALDRPSPRHHYISATPATPASSVHSGAAPKNLLGLDPSFVSKPAPLPTARPAIPVAQPVVTAKAILPSPFASLFNHPTAPLVAQGPGALPPVSAAQPAHAGHLPATQATKGVSGRVLRPHHQAPVAAVAHQAPAATYGGQFYTPTTVTPGYDSNGGSHVDTSLKGVIIGHKKH